MRCFRLLLRTILMLLTTGAVSSNAWADLVYNMPVGVTPVSRDVYDLHMLVFWICVAIGILVFSVMFYSLIMHRKSLGVKPADFHEHPVLEMIWAVIPFIILVVMAIPATVVLLKMNDTNKSELTVKITGYQWKWRYEYLDQGISFFSNLATPQDQIHNQAPKGENYLLEVDHPLVLPIHKKIRFLVTANDVIHSWWMPSFGIKTDAIPGFIHDTWAYIEKPGIYRGQCAELCGVNHGFMPIVVYAVSEEDFAKWVQQQGKINFTMTTATAVPTKPETKDELMAQGKKVYDSTCAVCHQVNGSGMPPAFPAMQGSKIAIGPVDAHINIVLNGKPGTAMQAFGPQLSYEDLAAVITYERNAFGNDDKSKYGKNAGGLVQPSEIHAAREKK